MKNKLILWPSSKSHIIKVQEHMKIFEFYLKCKHVNYVFLKIRKHRGINKSQQKQHLRRGFRLK